MADMKESNEAYIGTIAILTVLIQIRDGKKGKVEEDDIASAQDIYDKVRGNV